MGALDKIRHKMQAGKGRTKKEAGKATNDRTLEAKGKGGQVSGDLKEGADNVKDAFKK